MPSTSKRNSTVSVSACTNYTVTIGAGGAGADGPNRGGKWMETHVFGPGSLLLEVVVVVEDIPMEDGGSQLIGMVVLVDLVVLVVMNSAGVLPANSPPFPGQLGNVGGD